MNKKFFSRNYQKFSEGYINNSRTVLVTSLDIWNGSMGDVVSQDLLKCRLYEY